MRIRRESKADSAWLLPAHSTDGEADIRALLQQPVIASGEGLAISAQSSATEVIGAGESNAGPTNRLARRAGRTGRQRQIVTLPKWVNEKLPALDQILSARDVARLTRRRRWVVYALTLFGGFPRRRRFKGSAIGWAKQDIVAWLAKHGPRERRLTRRLNRRRTRSPLLFQLSLPMYLARTRRARGPCNARRGGKL